MNVRVEEEEVVSVAADLLVVPISSDTESDAAGALSEASGRDLVALAAEEGFESKESQTFVMRGLDGPQTSRVLLVGVGGDDDHAGGSFRRAAVTAIRKAKEMRCANVAIVAPDWHEDAARQLGEGALLGAYSFDRYRARDEDEFTEFESITFVGRGDIGGDIDKANIIAEAVNRARDLVNESPNVMVPDALAQAGRDIASECGLEATIFDEGDLHEKGFNLITAVGKGSAHPPCMAHLVYRPDGEVKKKVAFVGKGVTFDTGGYNLKPGKSMLHMHADMAGAAAVFGSALAIGNLAPNGVEVHFIVPTAENTVDGSAFKPQDIIRGYGGKTVEIHNTDAEGRLLLADALSYAQEQDVDAIVDLATLTGACVVALGEHTTGLFSDDEEMTDALLAASQHAGEDFWRLPLSKKLDELLDTPMADMKNVGPRWGGAITAALFLKRWVDIDAWAHLDIAGPAYADKDGDLSPQGGTGHGVATLVQYVLELQGGDDGKA